MDVTTKVEPTMCLCDKCHNDGCKSHLRTMRVVVACSDFVNAGGQGICQFYTSAGELL